ncbi:protein kinase domain-containing protein [Corallococcus macrosporus]|uniref:Serine/threonine kinase family protein n=1 Tax=Myxococcus fulvus (strain ATCC BAA-855 / HW-1) TaxID=483219 RepID=F8CM37_MYXFH|nr:protein kinase [Corallococcus macrosporus]AEI62805.1 serine/threonine kinase family protein [Corallococcus macrosporus]
MRPEHEAELHIAVAEGLVDEAQVSALREEALRQQQSPLSLLAHRRALSQETLASLQRIAADVARRGDPAPEGAATLEGVPATVAQAPGAPVFPVPGWERYQGIRFLGQGGMGQVFLARDLRLHRDVALKFVRSDTGTDFRRSLLEARAQARVDHERVCQVYEVGEVDGRPYIAMQFIDGQPLHQAADALGIEQKVVLLRDAAEGVQAAHRAGLIHRDIKPSNILVERAEDGRLKPYVMDFGLARDWRELDATATGAMAGTPHYMAPEQARGEVRRLDRRADVYSLGATLYHLLTGQFPIPGDNALEVLSRIATVEPRPPRAWEPDIPVDLEAIVLKCLEKERSARYDSPRALVEDLDRFLAGEPVRARPAGWAYRLRKKARKHRVVVGVAGAALVAVSLALGWASYTSRQASRREQWVRRFTEKANHIEALARYSALSRLHDTRADRQEIRDAMAALEAEVGEAGALAVGPGHDALGHGLLALGEDAAALKHLEAAWASGFHAPRTAWAMALVLGHLYQDGLREAERLRIPERREARVAELRRLYRDPALEYLRQSQGANVSSPEYLAALIAFYEDRLDDALARLDAMGPPRAWFHEALQLRGDILRTRASRRWNKGDRDGARADFDAGRGAYVTAIEVAQSVPRLHLSLAELEFDVLLMELYGQGDILAPFTRGTEAVARALQALPDFAEARILESGFHRRMAEHQMYLGADAEELLRKAVAAARAAVALAPTSTQARMQLGRCHWSWGQYLQQRNQDPREQLRLASAEFEQVSLEARSYDFYFDQGLLFGTWAAYAQQHGEDPLPHLDKALSAYASATRLDARLQEAWLNLGASHLNRATAPRSPSPDADLAQARAALEKARSLNPQHVASYFFLAQVEERAAKRHRARGADARRSLVLALEHYRQGSAINPQLPQLLNGAGLVLFEQAKEAWERGEDPSGLFEEALATLERAISVAPQQGFAYHNVSEVLLQRAAYQQVLGEPPDERLRAAMAASSESMERLPDFTQPRINLARAHVSLALMAFEQRRRDPRQELTHASRALAQALARNSNSAEGWQWEGEIRALRARWRAWKGQGRSEDFEGAAHAFQKAMELAPEREEALLASGRFHREWATWLQARGGAPEKALEQGLKAIDGALALRPGWPTARFVRGQLLLLRARAATRVEAEAAWRRQGQEALAGAIAANPHLERAGRGGGPGAALSSASGASADGDGPVDGFTGANR